jgi:hypothetical protein
LDTDESSELAERLRESPAVLVAQLWSRKSPVMKRHPSPAAAFVFEYELHLRLEAGPIQASFGRSHPYSIRSVDRIEDVPMSVELIFGGPKFDVPLSADS